MRRIGIADLVTASWLFCSKLQNYQPRGDGRGSTNSTSTVVSIKVQVFRVFFLRLTPICTNLTPHVTAFHFPNKLWPNKSPHLEHIFLKTCLSLRHVGTQLLQVHPGKKPPARFTTREPSQTNNHVFFAFSLFYSPSAGTKKMKLTFCSEIFGCIFSLYFSRLLAQCPGGQLRQSPQEKLLHGNYIFSCSRWIWTSDRTVCCGWHGAVTWMARTTASVLAQGSANGVDRFGKDLGTVCRHSSEHGDELDGRNFIPKRDTVSTMNPETGSVGKFTRCYKPASNIVGWFSFLVWHCIVHCLCQWTPTRLQAVTCLYDLAFGIFTNMAKHVFAQGFRAKHWLWFNEFVVLHLGRPGPLHSQSSITKRISIHDFCPAKFRTISAILEKPEL